MILKYLIVDDKQEMEYNLALMPKIEFHIGPAQLRPARTDHYKQTLVEEGHNFKVIRYGVFEVSEDESGLGDPHKIWHSRVNTLNPNAAGITVENGQLIYRETSTSVPEILQPEGFRLVREMTNIYVRKIRGGAAVVFTENEIMSRLHRSFELQPRGEWNTYERIAVPEEFLPQDLMLIIFHTPTVYEARNPYLRTDRIVCDENGNLVPNGIVHVRHRIRKQARS